MFPLNYIIWDVGPEMFTIPGIDHAVRWYGLMFAAAFLLGQQIMFYIFRKEGQPEKDVEKLTVYMVVATILGARLGHVLFYEPEKYLPNPLSILKIWEGGLASHGAAIGILLGLYLYSRKQRSKGQTFLWTVDRIVITVALAAFFIRSGNFMNSEILGKPTESENGVVFARSAVDYLESVKEIQEVDVYADDKREVTEEGLAPLTLEVVLKPTYAKEEQVRSYISEDIKNALVRGWSTVRENYRLPANEPLAYTLKQERRDGKTVYVARVETWGVIRHPAQMYEAISSLILFVILFAMWYQKKAALPQGSLLGIFLIYIFGLRFFYEFLKENQVAFEDNLALNMGQWLSIPLVLAGIGVLVYAYKNGNPQKPEPSLNQKA